MMQFPMTLSDPLPRFQAHNILNVKYIFETIILALDWRSTGKDQIY